MRVLVCASANAGKVAEIEALLQGRVELLPRPADAPEVVESADTLEGNARLVGSIWPASYYMHSSLGAFTKGLDARLMLPDILFLLCCIPILLLISAVGLRKQEK